MALSKSRATYWESVLKRATTNKERARHLFDLARSLAEGSEDPEAAHADLARLLQAWVTRRTSATP